MHLSFPFIFYSVGSEISEAWYKDYSPPQKKTLNFLLVFNGPLNIQS